MRARSIAVLLVPMLALASLYACSSSSNPAPAGTGGDGAPSETGTGNDTSTGSDTSTRDTSTTDSPTDGPGQDADADAATADEPDGFVPPIPVPCTQAQFDANDMTGLAGIAIVFPNAGAPVQYTNHCVKVSVGTVVTFEGKFSAHPLVPHGGDLPTPIPSQSINPPVGASGFPELDVTMDTAGNYGFRCNAHPGIMFGAIQVVP